MGLVFNIQEYAVNDGKGIRTTIFLKGCPLKCKWCSNPEGQNSYTELMHISGLCLKCHNCFQVCEREAVSLDSNEYPVFEREICKLCSEKICIDECLHNNLKTAGYEISAKKLFQKIKSNYLFFRNSSGGITLSGGEPLMQPEFVDEIINYAKSEGFTIGIETCGYFNFDLVENFIFDFDFIYYDIKCVNPLLHKKFTGMDNTLILNNLSLICQNIPERIIVSIPLIPGFNADENSLNEIIKVCLLNGIRKVRLLPYHKLGESKYFALGRDNFHEFSNIKEEGLHSFKTLFERNNISCSVE